MCMLRKKPVPFSSMMNNMNGSKETKWPLVCPECTIKFTIQTHAHTHRIVFIAQQQTLALPLFEHGNICRIYAFIWKLFVCLYYVMLFCCVCAVCVEGFLLLYEKKLNK